MRRKLNLRGKIILITVELVVLIGILMMFASTFAASDKKSAAVFSELDSILLSGDLQSAKEYIMSVTTEDLSPEVLKDMEEEIKNSIIDRADSINKEYSIGNIDYDEAIRQLNLLKELDSTILEVSNSGEQIEALHSVETAYQNTVGLMEAGKYVEAIEVLQGIIGNDTRFTIDALTALDESKNKAVESIRLLIEQSSFQAAQSDIEVLEGYFSSDIAVQEIRDYLSEQRNKLVKYEGPVEHIFFHDLVVYPEIAFNSNSKSFYDEYFVSADEYKRILEELYNNQYILIKTTDVWESKEVNGKEQIVLKDLMLPAGKKPLIISYDDFNFYERDRKYGLADKLILDGDENFASLVTNPQGVQEVQYEADSVSITEKFISEHPDFSFNNARGVLGFTGFEGILGYKTNLLDSKDYEEERAAAKSIIDKLREKGWEFACHSYHHNDMAEKSYDYVVYDTERWLKEVGSIIGETYVYLYPYGADPGYKSDKYKYLAETGFKYICSVGNHIQTYAVNGAISQGRRHVDGITLRRKIDLETLFSADDIIDSRRP